MKHLLCSLLLASVFTAGQVFAADKKTDDDDEFLIAEATCDDIYGLFEDATPGDDKDPEELAKAQDDVLYFVVWVHGYLSGRDGIDLKKRPLGQEGIEKIVIELDEMCKPDKNARFLDVVENAK